MQEIKKISILSTGKIFAVMGLILGIVIGIIIFAYTTYMITQFSNTEIQNALIMQYGNQFEPNSILKQLESTRTFGSLVFPLIIIVAMFIFGLIFAAVYNFLAKHTSGLKLQINTVEKKK